MTNHSFLSLIGQRNSAATCLASAPSRFCDRHAFLQKFLYTWLSHLRTSIRSWLGPHGTGPVVWSDLYYSAEVSA